MLEPAHDHDPAPLAQRLGGVLGLAAGAGVIDEVHSFFHDHKGTAGEVKAHNAVVAELSRLVEELTRKGRNVAIQVMLLTPAGHRDAIPTRIRDNCQVAICFATRTLDGAVAAALGEEIRQRPDASRSRLNDPAYAGGGDQPAGPARVRSGGHAPGRPPPCRRRDPGDGRVAGGPGRAAG
jgi:hypothetical protein